MTGTKPSAVFRCDASPEIGAGHVTRCLALAERLDQAGWRVGFAVSPDTTAMVPTILTCGSTLYELSGSAGDEPAELCEHCPDGANLFVIDHYRRDIFFEEACRGWAQKILVMDDATGRRHDCDILVDAATSDREVYAAEIPAQALLLVGSDYALMRRAFVDRRTEALRRRDGRKVENILISFGATDPWNVTPVVLDALAELADWFSITIAQSSQAPHLDGVRQSLRGRMTLALDADLPALMCSADIAIGAAGASSYERAVLGLPSIVVTMAENQRGLSRSLLRSGAALDAGTLDHEFATRLAALVDGLIADSAQRIRMAQAAGGLIDGRGAERLSRAVASIVLENQTPLKELRLVGKARD